MIKDRYEFQEARKKQNNYPHWICFECAMKNGGQAGRTLSTYHESECGWCRTITSVTQPCDFGYPDYSDVNKGDK